MTEDEKIAAAKAEMKSEPAKLTFEEREAAAKARIEKAEARRKAPARMAELEELEKTAEASEVLAEIEERYGTDRRSKLVSTVGGPVVIERGEDVLWKRFRTAADAAGKKPIGEVDVRDFVVPNVKYPLDAKKFVTDFPAALGDLATEIGKLYGLKVEDDAGK
jgi:hypothetical protein